MSGRLDGKVAFITGAGSGIGRAAAILFAGEGATVVIAERDAAAGRAATDAVLALGGRAMFVETDVTIEASVRDAVARAAGAFGRIDVLYNNAGGSTAVDARVTDCPADEFWRRIGTDLFGTWITCKYGIAAMMANGGSVINSSSVFAVVGTVGKDAYTAAKGGVSAITRSMAVEYAPFGIRVNALAPAVTLTERVAKLVQAQPEVLGSTMHRQALGLIQPADVAALALFLATDASGKITGQVIPIDGGFSAS